ncbi:MAG: hypothetical protein GY838_17990 [bacterium]|nr:hypothetical protein [bacterium]
MAKMIRELDSSWACLLFGFLFAMSFVPDSPTAREDLTLVSGKVVDSWTHGLDRVYQLESPQGDFRIRAMIIGWPEELGFRPEEVREGDLIEARVERRFFGKLNEYAREIAVNGEIVLPYTDQVARSRADMRIMRWTSGALTAILGVSGIVRLRRRRSSATPDSAGHE